MEFVCLFLRRHLAEKPVVGPQDAGCFLKLHILMHVTVNSRLVDPCYNGHPDNTDSSQILRQNKLQTLTEINSHYYGLSLMRTLTQGPYSVCYRGSWLYFESCFCKWDVLQIITLLGIVVHFAGQNGELFGGLKYTEITNKKRESNSYTM